MRANPLTPRQRETLEWSAQGKTCWETSVIMACTPATVNYHLKQIFKKLEVTNKAHAVFKAAELGILPPRWNNLPEPVSTMLSKNLAKTVAGTTPPHSRSCPARRSRSMQHGR
jgi:DNA-binding CsgD family transcriptional regulator